MNIPFHKTHITQEEVDVVTEAMLSGWMTSGPKVIEFEEEFRRFVGSGHSVAVNSATAALHLALKAVGLKEGDEVIIPTNTFVATAEVVSYFNAKPVLCDIDYFTHNIDADKIVPLITDKTVAIIPVHFAGLPCDMDKISSIADEYDLFVIEDAAHALPSYYKGEIVGATGKSDICCFSFYATKTLSTGEGGMATTNNESFYKNMKINRLHGFNKDAWNRYSDAGSWFYDIVDNGYKYNTTDINASIGIVQLKKQELLRDKRERIAKRYSDGLALTSFVELPLVSSGCISSWHLFVVKVKDRDGLHQYLKSNGIGTSVHFIPVHMHSFYKNKYDYVSDDYPVANDVYSKSLSLPIYPDMTDEEVDYVISTVLDYYK